MHQHPLGKMVTSGDNVGDGDRGGGGDYIIDIVVHVHFCKHGSGYNQHRIECEMCTNACFQMHFNVLQCNVVLCSLMYCKQSYGYNQH